MSNHWYDNAEVPRPQLEGEHKQSIGFTNKSKNEQLEERLLKRGVVIVKKREKK